MSPRKKPALRAAAPASAPAHPTNLGVASVAATADPWPYAGNYEAPATAPFSGSLLIVRAPGGFVIFNADEVSDPADAAPHTAVALAGTPGNLIGQIGAWANKLAPTPPR